MARKRQQRKSDEENVNPEFLNGDEEEEEEEEEEEYGNASAPAVENPTVEYGAKPSDAEDEDDEELPPGSVGTKSVQSNVSGSPMSKQVPRAAGAELAKHMSQRGAVNMPTDKRVLGVIGNEPEVLDTPVDFDTEGTVYTWGGRHYGPGVVQIADGRCLRDLEAARERIRARQEQERQMAEELRQIGHTQTTVVEPGPGGAAAPVRAGRFSGEAVMPL